jgi:SAM-dependent methyltransferase
MDYSDYAAGYTSNFFWFRAKNNLIKILASKVCKKNSKAKILIIGAGTGDELKVISAFGQNYVVDNDQNALAMIAKGFYFEKKLADACDLPYGDGFFDMAVSLDVFEHIENDRLAVKEICRVLKKNGALIFTVPAFQKILSSHDKALHHLRRYDKKRLNDIFSDFAEKKFYYWNSALFLPISAARLVKKNSKSAIDRICLPPLINNFFYALLSLDNILINRGHSLPMGLTITGYCLKR